MLPRVRLLGYADSCCCSSPWCCVPGAGCSRRSRCIRQSVEVDGDPALGLRTRSLVRHGCAAASESQL
jgi:hypothetical protein